MRRWRGPLACVAILTLQGCVQETCMDISGYPISACLNSQFCNDASPEIEVTIERGTMDECVTECAYRNCTAIQYDCGTRCMILAGCQHLAPSTCGSSVYFVNHLELTTTTTSTTHLGACYMDSQPNENYVCSQGAFCQQMISEHLGFMSLSDCLAECDWRLNCRSVVYGCQQGCWMYTAHCGREISSNCQAIYHKAIFTTTTPATTTSTTTTTQGEDYLRPLCFQTIEDTGAYVCDPMRQCRNQAFSTTLPDKLSLAECMSKCDEDLACTSFVHCISTCSLMIHVDCEGETPINYHSDFPGNCGSLYRKVSGPTTTKVPAGCDPGATEAPYRCEPFRACGNKDFALNLGSISLQACMAQCEVYDCGVIQYECSECLLLEECSGSADSSCGSSVYFRDRLWPSWLGTTTTTTVYGECRPNTVTDLLDFSCQSGRRCLEPAQRDLGLMPLESCAEHCRESECRFIQYDCNERCLIYVATASCTTTRSDCGGSIYYRIPRLATAASSHRARDGRTAVVYSPYRDYRCFGDGCVSEARCPGFFWPTHCRRLPGLGGAGVGITMELGLISGDCKGWGIGIIVEAVCSNRLRTIMHPPEGSLERSVECPEGTTLMSCNCWVSSGDACGDHVHFLPLSSAQRCELETSGDGARIGAICVQGESIVELRNGAAQKVSEEVKYCGWADAAGDHEDKEADCRGWMQDPSDTHVGACKTSECRHFADCVRKCNACGICVGVRHNSDGSPLYDDEGIQCTMQAAYQDRDAAVLAARSGTVVYVNSRSETCSPVPAIRKITLFADSECTRVVYPQSIKAGDAVVQSNWSTVEAAYVPHCSPHCASGEIALSASFALPTAVLCAVVISSGMAQGWELDLSQGTLSTSAGTLVAYNRAPDAPPSFRKGTAVTFDFTLRLGCTILSAQAACMEPSLPLLALRLSGMLGVPVHAIQITSGNARSQLQNYVDSGSLGEAWRLQPVTIHWGRLLVSLKLVIETPFDADLVTSVTADLEAMRARSDLLIPALDSLHPHLVNISLSEISRNLENPVRKTIPLPTTTTVTTTTEQEVQVQSEDNLEMIAAITVMVTITCCGCVLSFLGYRRIRITKGQRHEVTSRGPSAVVVGGRASLRTHEGELEPPLSEDALRNVPSYWVGAKDATHLSYASVSWDYLAFSHLWYVPYEQVQLLQELVNRTYRPIPTQDRLCPTREHEKMRGGCPCVRPGGTPGLPTGFQVKRVIRVEDADMFSRYIHRRREIIQKRDCEAPDPPFFTTQAAENISGMSDVLSSLNEDINEVYLWHGTSARAGLQIAREDFKLTFAGSGAGTMYGKALYFSESATKADEYSKDEESGHYEGVRALLLCRVVVGMFHYTLEREPTAANKFKAGESDSTLGDRAKAVGTFREVAIYDPDQVYPEYLILYQRLHGDQPTSISRGVPYSLELPLYWANVARNPYEEGFREHWVVKIQIQELIQRLANGSCSGTLPTVKRVRRVEDSFLWCRYINWKRNLGRLVESGKPCVPPHELDTTSGGEVLTAKILQEFHRDEAMSVENMAPGLNELLLWHGTSRQAAEAIAEEGFMMAESVSSKNLTIHGRRYGPGIYLAEDLTKSLSYSKKHDGVYYALLCRAVCGHLHYTEDDHNFNIPQEAAEQKKTAVLANPKKLGPREYIVFDAAQVYPEYIIELTF